MTEKMRAMVLSKLGPIETKPLKLTQIDKHQIKNPNEVLIKIEACGVCHSQLHGVEGDWVKYGIPPGLPTVPGHEIVGKIVELGKNVTKFKIGDRAGISPLHGSCMNCIYCKEGKENLCDKMDVTGESLLGGYAEYITVSEDFATLVPSSLSPEFAAPLFCAGITAYKAVKASEPAKGKSLGIFGIGGVGHMAIQFGVISGSKVIGISRSENHLDVAKRLGASTIPYDSDQSRFLSKLYNQEGLLDSAIVLAPSENVTDTAIKSVRKGGTMVIATFGNIPNFDVTSEKTIRGTLIGSIFDSKEVVRIAKEKGLKVISEKFPLEQANEVLAKLKVSEIEARAVLVP
ncbi:MAG: alcohol dehydrogenase catalytic domain-containing protein [Nitrosopumilaceae archaeon]